MQVIPFGKIDKLKEQISEYSVSHRFVLFDTNTQQHCSKLLFSLLPELREASVIVTQSGDHNKTLDQCTTVWKTLVEKQASKNAILINVGGGMITDLGGYCAANYKRGIDFINVPTSLLGMVDASIGGKTGVNFLNFKNQIGVFAKAKSVLLHPKFLDSLPRNELHSGLAEMIKHQLLFNANAVSDILARKNIKHWTSLETILESVDFKKSIVDQDYRDEGLRQSLNFGHTIGHAIESFSHEKKTPLLHGEAIILGMIEELKLSENRWNTPPALRAMLMAIKKIYFPILNFSYRFEKLIPFLKQDKKNQTDIGFSLLEDAGKPKLHINISLEDLQNELA
jgi:3-dehydroquinate synthase